jgi:hypothetical protein
METVETSHKETSADRKSAARFMPQSMSDVAGIPSGAGLGREYIDLGRLPERSDQKVSQSEG